MNQALQTSPDGRSFIRPGEEREPAARPEQTEGPVREPITRVLKFTTAPDGKGPRSEVYDLGSWIMAPRDLVTTSWPLDGGAVPKSGETWECVQKSAPQEVRRQGDLLGWQFWVELVKCLEKAPVVTALKLAPPRTLDPADDPRSFMAMVEEANMPPKRRRKDGKKGKGGRKVLHGKAE